MNYKVEKFRKRMLLVEKVFKNQSKTSNFFSRDECNRNEKHIYTFVIKSESFEKKFKNLYCFASDFNVIPNIFRLQDVDFSYNLKAYEFFADILKLQCNSKFNIILENSFERVSFFNFLLKEVKFEGGIYHNQIKIEIV